MFSKLEAVTQDLKGQFYAQQHPGSAKGSASSHSDGTHMGTDGSPVYPYSPMAWMAPAPFAPVQVQSLQHLSRVACWVVDNALQLLAVSILQPSVRPAAG